MTDDEAKPRARNRGATEDALRAAAVRVFAERGYENATTKAIAEAAGCSEGLIQRYFGGKEGLLVSILRDPRHEAENAAFFERPLCGSMLQEARECLAAAARNMGERADAIRIVLSRVLIDPAFRNDFARLTHKPQLEAQMRARFERYAEAGMIDAALAVGDVVDMLMGFNFQVGFLHPQVKLTPPAEVLRMSERLAEFFARAVAPTDPRTSR